MQNAAAKVRFFLQTPKFFRNFATHFSIYCMFKRYLGLILMAIGVVSLTLLQVFHLTFLNVLLLLSLALVAVGLVVHVWLLKRQSNY